MSPNVSKTVWKIIGEELVTCNCAWGCRCQFNALPTKGHCEAVTTARIVEGHYGATKLDGLAIAGVWWWPAAIHQGNGIVRPIVDERASAEQRAALLNIMSAKDGGMPFEIFMAMVTKVLDPVFLPIRLEIDRQKRTGLLHVPDHAEFRCEPIKNPITGEEHRAIIKLPNGFEYQEAEMGNTVMMKASLGDKTLRNENSYAQFATINWTNA